MERIRQCAEVSVRRACAFGLLAIATTMVGFSSDFSLALRAGAILLMLMAAILCVSGIRAERKPYKHREVWLLMERSHGLPEPRAQETISRVMRELFYSYAKMAAISAAALWSLDFLARLVR